MNKCTVCDSHRSSYILNNKTVCFRCDDLMFDIEIESEEEPVKLDVLHQNRAPVQTNRIPLTIVKK